MAFEELKEEAHGPQVELLGRHLATLEHHCGLIEYDSTVLRAKAHGCEVRITGENLALTALTLDELALEGEIHAVEFVSGGEGTG